MEKPTRALWFNDPPATDDGNGRRIDDRSLTLDEVRDTWGPALLAWYLKDPDFRREYYRLSYTWHDKAYPAGVLGGKYGDQWCKLFERVDAMPTLHLGDFAGLHNYLFFSLRRAIMDQTCHVVDPDAESPPSFHMVPNDQGADGHTPGELGLSLGTGP
jgi:hypothetical protein